MGRYKFEKDSANMDKVNIAAIKNKPPLLMSLYRHVRNKMNKLNIELEKQYFCKRVSQTKGNMK